MKFKFVKVLALTSVIAGASLLSACAPPPPPDMWTCYATDARGATWKWSAYRLGVARFRVNRLCAIGSYEPRTCTLRCVPPAV